MFVQTQTTPNPNSLKFLPGKIVSNDGSYEIIKKNKIDNDLVRNILSINGVTSIFLGKDFISVNKNENINWEDIKHIVISLINEYYQLGNEFVIDKDFNKKENVSKNLIDIEKKIINILDTKIRPAVAKDGGDIKFEGFNNGIVKVAATKTLSRNDFISPVNVFLSIFLEWFVLLLGMLNPLLIMTSDNSLELIISGLKSRLTFSVIKLTLTFCTLSNFSKAISRRSTHEEHVIPLTSIDIGLKVSSLFASLVLVRVFIFRAIQYHFVIGYIPNTKDY